MVRYPPWFLVLHRHICAIPRFATYRAIIVRYPIKTSTKEFCDTIATSIARYEKYRCAVPPYAYTLLYMLCMSITPMISQGDLSTTLIALAPLLAGTVLLCLFVCIAAWSGMKSLAAGPLRCSWKVTKAETHIYLSESQKNPRAHKIKSALPSPPPKPQIPPLPGFSCRTDAFFQASILKLAQPFPAPEKRGQLFYAIKSRKLGATRVARHV